MTCDFCGQEIPENMKYDNDGETVMCERCLANSTFGRYKYTCDFCGHGMNINHFPDDFTYLCQECAGTGMFMTGEQALEYAKSKSTKKTKCCDYCGRKIDGTDCYDDDATTMCDLCEQSGKFGHY